MFIRSHISKTTLLNLKQLSVHVNVARFSSNDNAVCSGPD